MAKSLKIADTTREQREQIVAESIGNISGLCDGCSPGIIEMYQDYIEGRKELREINAAFGAGHMSGGSGLRFSGQSNSRGKEWTFDTVAVSYERNLLEIRIIKAGSNKGNDCIIHPSGNSYSAAG